MLSLLKNKQTLFTILSLSVVLIIYNIFYFRLNDSGTNQVKIFNNISDSKYVLFECSTADICGGWADRLKGLLSAYAYSLILNRTFLIKMSKSCDLSNIMDENLVAWDYKKVPNLNNLSIENFHIGWNFQMMEQLKSVNVINRSKELDLITVKAGIMFADSFSQNIHLKKRINELGYEQSKFTIHDQMNNWYKKIFKLSKNLQGKYNSILEQLKPKKSSKLICAQIRMGDPGHIGATDPNIDQHYWKFINQTFLNQTDSNLHKIFVTADRESVKSSAKNFFTNNEVIFLANSSFHVETQNKECQSLENVLLDFHILQNCDIGVVSHSGFGILGMWNRNEPFKDLYVYTRKNQTAFKQDYWNRKNLTFVKYETINDLFFT